MKIKVKEVARRSGIFTITQSGLGVAVLGEGRDVPSDLVAAVVAPVMKWRDKRGKLAFTLAITFSVDPDMHRAIESALFHLYRQNEAFGKVLDRMNKISVTLCDEEGYTVMTYQLDMVSLLSGIYRRTEVESFAVRPRERVEMDEDEDEDEEEEEEDEEEEEVSHEEHE